MFENINKAKITLVLVAIGVAALSLSIAFTSSCTKRLDGEEFENRKPIVYFVNIPPAEHRFSRNPEIYWVGSDRDGIIVSFRYHVTTAVDMEGAAPLDYAMSLTDEEWIQLEVDPKGPDPQTANTVSMSANLTDPVRSFVDQYIFVQAFDEEGLASDIIYRFFSRNDNPPITTIFGFGVSDTPFVNSIEPGGVVTGVKLRWEGNDQVDYPSDPPPFEFDWRLYGPYNDADTAIINDKYITEVYLTHEGLVYWKAGFADTLDDTTFYIYSDSLETDTLRVVNGSAHYLYWDLDEETGDSAWIEYTVLGSVEEFFRVDDKDFLSSRFGQEAKLVQSSDGWTTAVTDTLWNVYRNYHSDTTLQMNFIFWTRSRDDALVPDPVPAFQALPVINPRYERDVAILNFNSTTENMPNYPRNADTIKSYWKNAIDTWGDHSGYKIDFDTTTIVNGPLAGTSSSPDYFWMKKYNSGVPIGELLKHKVLILYNDKVGSPGSDQWFTIYRAIDAGINVWLTMRCPLGNSMDDAAEFNITPPFDYIRYFGVVSMDFSGWFCHVPLPGFTTTCKRKGFFQDFIGAYAKKDAEWPHLNIDTALLHSRYAWKMTSPVVFSYWDSLHPALPEVNWSSKLNEAEVLYKYKSLYGRSHPLGNDVSFEGAPVGQRYETSKFRTVHFNFTPLSIESDSMQIVVDSVMNWIYDPNVGVLTSDGIRYKDAPVRISVSEARENYRERCRVRKENIGW
ncbi:MAG: hypothetical protein U9R56_02590 [candidate division Zixibacteria bacterium]|nr:hypothetical protein [candidate division Zixibacteria bacterium]